MGPLKRTSLIAAGVFDDFTVVGQAAGGDELNVGAQFGDVAHSFGDALAQTVGVSAHFDMQSHLIVGHFTTDDQAGFDDLGEAFGHLIDLTGDASMEQKKREGYF